MAKKDYSSEKTAAHAIKKRRVRKMVIALFIIIGIIFIGLLVVLVNSPGVLPQLKDENGNVIKGSISEKVWVEIGGINQGMFIRGENLENPIILYVHGGPGTPMLQFINILEK